MRGCYDGLSTYLGNTRGDLWGCLGVVVLRALAPDAVAAT